jgi:anoctamin-10/anoctamin-7
LGTFADYADMMMQFGYATMFISSYPLATILAFVNNYIEMRVDGWKLTQFCRRPEPRAAENIGTWFAILEIISSLAVLVNAGLVCFTGTFAEGQIWAVRVWIFIGMSAGIFLVKYAVSIAVPDTPKDIEIQLRRKAYIVNKIVHNIPDENEDDLMKNVKSRNVYTIRITDDDPL